RMNALPFVTELRDCPVVAVGNEDRVVAEARGAAAFGRELAFEHAAHVYVVAAGRKRHDLGDHARAPVLLAGEPLEQRVGLIALRRPAGGVQAGRPVEGVALDAGILAEHPDVGRRAGTAEPGLDPRILLVRLAGLGRPVVGREGSELPTGQSFAQLLELVRVLRGEQGLRYRRQRTAITSSRSESVVTSDSSAGVTSSSVTTRRSRWSSTSIWRTSGKASSRTLRGEPSFSSTTSRRSGGRKRSSEK